MTTRARIAPVLVLICLGSVSEVRATVRQWTNPLGGSAATNTNWSPVAVPAAGDDLTFGIPGAFAVTWNASVAASNTQTYRAGTVTVNINNPHTIASGLTVALNSGDTTTAALASGQLNLGGPVVVGNTAGSAGTLNVSSSAFLDIGNGADLTVGQNGNGTMSILSLGRVDVADQFIVGSNATSTANVSISGSQVSPPFAVSRLIVHGSNSSRVGQGGDAVMTVSNGALAHFFDDLIIANGSASTSSITVQTSGLLDARLKVEGDLLIGRNVSAGVAAGVGTLQLNTGGQADVTGDTLLGDPDGGTGTINMSGGIMICDGAIDVRAGSIISGTGTIDADITNAGSITPTGANGLTFNGIVSNTQFLGINGTRVFFGATGGYIGSGSCIAEINGASDALITATGPLTLGRFSTGGYFYLGALDVNTQSVTLRDSNGAVLGGLTTIAAGGDLGCVNGIGIQNGGRIRGQGTLEGNVINSGSLDPQRSPTPGGVMTVDGELTFNPSGTLDIEIGGPPATNQHDRVNVTGTASFQGTVRLTLPTGYKPRVGEQFIICNAFEGRTGEFDNLIAPTPCSQVTFVLVYSSTAAIALVRPPIGCTALGDLNSDGQHDGLDIQLFVNALFSASYESCADMNGDCVNDGADVPIFATSLLN